MRDSAAEDAQGLERLHMVRSGIPAVTHVDFSARLQTLTEQRNGRIQRLLAAFDRLTGCSVLLNTSFNGKDEPIVCTIADDWNCFVATGIDVLVLERFVVTKPICQLVDKDTGDLSFSE